MKRSGFKTSGKGLKRTQLKRGKPLQGRARLRPQSQKQVARDRKFRGVGVPVGELCAICGVRYACDADHIQSRAQRPDLRADPTNRRWLCRPCHVEVTAYPDVEGETYEKARNRKQPTTTKETL